MPIEPSIEPPIAMLAELTHRCPLACPYCSNPTQLAGKAQELSTHDWSDVFQQAAALGVLQLHLSGGEPAARADLTELVAAAHTAGLYTNLITSGIGLSEAKLRALEAAGLDHLQLSLQGTGAEIADWVADYRGSFARKKQCAEWVTAIGIPLTLNMVLHRSNLHQLLEAMDLALEMGARRIELAMVQFHGWALKNRAQLMPTKQQASWAAQQVAQARERLKGQLVIDYVAADYHEDYPKNCMGGWGANGFVITPDGVMLPCHAAQTLPHLRFEHVRETSLSEIWYQSAAFNAYRGDDWMQEPCKSCDRKAVDNGGCRCQALALTGDASAADPVCIKSPQHSRVAEITSLAEEAAAPAFTYRARSA